MKLLSSSKAINSELVRLLEECSSCQIAVAWASLHPGFSGQLRRSKKKIFRMVVGTHFYQTDPNFIREFLDHKNTRFVRETGGVFHPKAYYFEMADENWKLVVGSANLTGGGLGKNDEMAVVVGSDEKGAERVRTKFSTALKSYWNQSEVFSKEDLATYERLWKIRKPKRDALGKAPRASTAALLDMTWDEYFSEVQKDENFQERLKVIRAMRDIFSRRDSFAEMSSDERKQVAGTFGVSVEGVNYKLFGNMRRSHEFVLAVKENDSRLSRVLDAIPHSGEVSEKDYAEAARLFQKALPKGKFAIGSFSRVLAMKRPDVFVCLGGPSRRNLCRSVGVPVPRSYEKFWDGLIVRVRGAVWWSEPGEFRSDDEEDVWRARVAFLDALYYDGPA